MKRPRQPPVPASASLRIHAAGVMYFDAVCRAGSIREASRRLNVASSAVNRQILKLEAEVGVPLFERFASGTRLTPAGEALARHVVAVLQDLERTRTDIDGLKGAQAGHVAIAAIEGAASVFLPATLAALAAQAPLVTTSVVTLGSVTVSAALLEGGADIGIAFDVPQRSDLRRVARAPFALGAVMRPDHPLAAGAEVEAIACLDHPLVLPTADLSIADLLGVAMARPLHDMPAVARTSSVEMMRELVMRGVGIAFQTRVGLERAIRDGRLVHVPLRAPGPVWSEMGIYVRDGRTLPPAIGVVLGILTEQLRRYEAGDHEV